MRFSESKSAIRMDPASRTLLLGALGAVLGLLLAGYSLFTARGTATHGVPPEDVALVNGRAILQSDFVAQTQVETGAPFKYATQADRERVLQDMIDEELLVQRGLDVDLAASDPDVRSAMVAGVNLQVDAEILASQPDQAALEAYFTAHRDRYAIDGMMDLRDLVAKPGAGADAGGLIAAIKAGATLDAASRHFGFVDGGRLGRGDNYDFGVKAKLGEALYHAAAALANGQVAGPVAEGGIVHVLVMIHRQPIRLLDFAAARDTVFQDIQRDARTRVEHQNLAFLRSRADIQVAPGFTP